LAQRKLSQKVKSPIDYSALCCLLSVRRRLASNRMQPHIVRLSPTLHCRSPFVMSCLRRQNAQSHTPLCHIKNNPP